MLKGKWKLLICGLLIVCIGFMVSNNVFAAINEGYYENTPVADANLEEKIANSPLLEAIGSVIYAVGSLMEWVLGMVFKAITGTNMFPWADAILFNAVPFLDVNIFTAADNSLVSILYVFLTGTYYSLLTMASTFFGIAVMVSAVKLAITAIAEDKARYKKAIVDWILGLVMLWGIHFFISFVLYLNEQLVVVASNIVSSSLADAGDEIVALADTSDYNSKIVGNFVNLMEKGKTTLGSLIGIIAKVVGGILLAIAIGTIIAATGGTAAAIIAAVAKVAVSGIIGAGLWIGGTVYNTNLVIRDAKNFHTMSVALEDAKKDMADKATDEVYTSMKEWMFTEEKGSYTYSDGKTYYYDNVDICAALLKSDAYTSKYLADLAEDGKFFTLKKPGTKAQVARLYCDASTLVGDITFDDDSKVNAYDYYKAQLLIYESIPVNERVTSGSDKNYDADMVALYTSYCNIFEQYVLKQKSSTNIIYNLASYFKETAFEVSETGWKANKAVIQNAIMYVLLVSYSLVFFISYTKRLFYVIMLILMAPIVVVFDFFLKSTK